MNQLFIIEGKDYGSCYRSPIRVHAEAQDPVSLIYFCYKCGTQFASASINNRPYQAIRAVCSTCPAEGYYWNWVPGSIWLDWDENFNKNLPDEVIQREFKLHLEKIENEQETVGSEGTVGGPFGHREDLCDRDCSRLV